MVFLVRLLVALVLVGVLLAVAPATAQLAKPICQEHCGDVSIPYPFGLQSDCSLNKDFLITCYTTDSTPPQKEAFLWNSTIKVINISMDGELQIRSAVSRRCFSSDGEEWTTNWLRLSKFTVSSKNKFTVVGCDSYAYLRGSRAGVNYSAGCMSICDSIKSVYTKSCAGSGCCQIEIPDGLSFTNVTAYSFNSHKKAGDHKLSSACKDDATSYDLDKVSRYRCKCKDGYEGNPYIGCRDIDECARPNNCSHKCTNTDGNYTCTCPKGYHGDGRKDGERCTASQFPLMKIIIGVGIGVTVLFVATSWLYLVLKQRKLIKLREKFFRENGGFILRQKLSGQQGNPDMAKIFTDEELKKATNNFEESTVVGKGGFGTVYRGILADNREVAIKKSISVDQNQIEQFINEVVVLSQINHRNVVRLLGCCLETRVPLLVYEFISNGTVFDCMHNQRNASALSWELRLRIAAETAGALSYLHSAASVPIIHRDVKTTNMLLDANYTAKLSDFGASRLVPLDETQLSTMVQGTLGYLDPEYLRTNQLTEKSDVYSFGVVLAELLTGKKALSFDRPEEERSLAAHFLTRVKEGKLFEILERHIVNEGNEEQVMEVARLAKRCLNLKGDERPSMKEVAMELEGLHMMNMHPWAVVNAEETEFLLTREESNAFNNGDGFTASSAGIDSMKDNLLVSVGGGR
uniref:Protein kinase domain-containing protein n=1 Tax=Manihot esculenta TaxID=3983 RepID=A0A2C9WG83_MANES